MKKWTREDKAIVECISADVYENYTYHLTKLDEKGIDENTDIGVQMYRKEIAFLEELHKMIAADIKASSNALKLEIEERYTCLQSIYYEDSKDEMFTKGNVYVVLRNFRGLGLMSNDGIIRTERDIPEEMNTEYFKLETKYEETEK